MFRAHILGEFSFGGLHEHSLALASFVDAIHEHQLLLIRHLLLK